GAENLLAAAMHEQTDILHPPAPALMFDSRAYGQIAGRRTELAEALRQCVQLALELGSPKLAHFVRQAAIAASPVHERSRRGVLDRRRSMARAPGENVQRAPAEFADFV